MSAGWTKVFSHGSTAQLEATIQDSSTTYAERCSRPGTRNYKMTTISRDIFHR